MLSSTTSKGGREGHLVGAAANGCKNQRDLVSARARET
jgi:hypothetical protein